MSGDVSTSLLCKDIFWPLEILGSTPSFQIWSSGQFCTTTYLNISLKLPPKLWDVNRSILFNFMQKSSYVLWKIWVNQPHFHSGPTWWFVLQPYFNLLLYPWFYFLLIDHPAKPLSPRDQPHRHVLSWPDCPFPFLSRFEFHQNLHCKVPCFTKPTPPPSFWMKGTPIWNVLLPSESFRCHWHFIKHL